MLKLSKRIFKYSSFESKPWLSISQYRPAWSPSNDLVKPHSSVSNTAVNQSDYILIEKAISITFLTNIRFYPINPVGPTNETTNMNPANYLPNQND